MKDDILLRGDGIDDGSAKRTAVAFTVLGTTNPEFTKNDENTDITTAPGIPMVRNDTSARTTGF